MLNKKGIIVCFLLIGIKISFSCLTANKPTNKPTNEPTCRGTRCGGTCKTENDEDCDFKAVYLKGDEKRERWATTCSSFELGGTLSLKPWCYTDAENKKTGICKDDCLGVRKETMEIAKNNGENNCVCGLRNNDAANAITRIVLGTPAKLGEFPWQVAILKKESTTFNVFLQGCGGALVGEKHVVTAAHCFWKKDPNDPTKKIQAQPDDMQVLIGATNLVADGKKRSSITRIVEDLSEVRMHPNYVKDKKENDIAVLVLKGKVDLYSYPNIKPVCLPFQSKISELHGKTAIVSGWGKTGKKDAGMTDMEPATSELQYAPVKIETNCDHGTKDAFCAQGSQPDPTSTKTEGPCRGDSGGPLVLKKDSDAFYSLIGVVSYNKGACSQAGEASKYADVSYLLKEDGWLMTALMDGRTCGGAPIIPITGDDPPNKEFYESLFLFRPKIIEKMSTSDAKACQEVCKEDAKCQSWYFKEGECKLGAATKLQDGATRGTKHFPKFQ